jgi:hypothetical protein
VNGRASSVVLAVALALVVGACGGAVQGSGDADTDPLARDASAVDAVDARATPADVGPHGDATSDDDAESTRGDDAGVPGACPVTTTVTLERARVALSYWPGDAPPSAVVALSVSDRACTRLHVTSDAAWLVASADPVEGLLAVRVESARTLSGDHRARVVLRAEAGGGVLASLDVTLRALVAPGPGAARRVLVVGLDGVRADALVVADTPHLDQLARHGWSTSQASTQLTAPTVSGPGWSSIFTGVEASRHRIFGNGGWASFDRSYPSFVARARSAGLRTAAACNWTPILDEILEDDALDWSARGDDDAVTTALGDSLRAGLHDVHYVHLNDPDAAGHGSGFATYSEAYVGALEASDARVGRLLDALFARPTLMSEDWLIIVTTDHGGESRDHGPLTEACRRIPLIVSGTGAARDYQASEANHMDVAATVLHFLGLPSVGPALDGRPLALPVEGRCADGVDDDRDGDLDCADTDCAADRRCSGVAPVCPGTDLGSALGPELARVDVRTATAWHSGSCGGAAGREVTFAWTAPADDTYAFDTIGSTFDTVLYTRRGCGAAELACGDDYYPGPRQDVPINRQSGIRVSARAGESLVLFADASAADVRGDLVLSAYAVRGSCPDRDLGAATGRAVASGNNSAAPSRYRASCAGLARDVVMVWTTPADGDYVFETVGSSFDTVLTLSAGRCTEAELACSDDLGGGVLQSRLTRRVVQGEVLTVVVGGFRGRTGDWSLSIERQ